MPIPRRTPEERARYNRYMRRLMRQVRSRQIMGEDAAAHATEESKDPAPWCSWKIPMPRIPMFVIGKARIVKCERGHRFFCTEIPERCPASCCGERLHEMAGEKQMEAVV